MPVRTRLVTASSIGSLPRVATATLLALTFVKLALQLLPVRHYGIFRDELYYLACGEHLAWGYVDQPPLVAAVAWFVRATLGDSLLAIRLLPALAGGALVFLTGVMARRLGGGRFAQGLAALAVLVVPAYLFLHHVLTMNAFEPLFWMGGVFLAMVMMQTGRTRPWLWLGVLAGVGLLNKHSMVFFGTGLVAGLLLTPERALLRGRWVWLGGAMAFAICLPHVIWQAQHGWPQLEILRNVARGKNYEPSPLEFLSGQIVAIGPVIFPIWLAGLGFLFFARDGRPYRALGYMYVLLFAVFIVLHGKFYYLLPIYPVLLAVGAVSIERAIERRAWGWLKPLTVTAVAVAGLLMAPLALPLLPVEAYLRYAAAIGISEVKMETHAHGRLPQVYADMFGWEKMVATIAQVYHSLPEEERLKAAIFTQNYGEAGAIDYFGPGYGLPKAISGHNTYFLWGPRHYTGDVVIVIGGKAEDLKQYFEQVDEVTRIMNDYAMPYESNLPVWLCLDARLPMAELWPRVKHYD